MRFSFGGLFHPAIDTIGPAGALLVNGHALEVNGHPLTLGEAISSYGSFAIVDETGDFIFDEEAAFINEID